MIDIKRFKRALWPVGTFLAGGLLGAVGLGAAAHLSADHAAPRTRVAASEETDRLSAEVADLKGRIAVNELTLARLNAVAQYSNAYRIPANVSARIYDAALAEGLHPSLGYQLVKVESGFRSHIRSTRGAIGYTQVRLKTGREIDPSLTESDLLDQATNLRIGFRILRRLLRQFDNDLELALRAYNLGPTGALMSLVDSTANAQVAGYTETVMKGVKTKKGLLRGDR